MPLQTVKDWRARGAGPGAPEPFASFAHEVAGALEAFYIQGPAHNVPFLSAVMDQERFRSGALRALASLR